MYYRAWSLPPGVSRFPLFYRESSQMILNFGFIRISQTRLSFHFYRHPLSHVGIYTFLLFILVRQNQLVRLNINEQPNRVLSCIVSYWIEFIRIAVN